jgi:hypothetical protein
LGPLCGRIAFDRRVGAGIAHLPDLAGQPHCGQIREGGDALTQDRQIWRKLAGAVNRSRAVSGRLDPAFDVFAHCFGIAPETPGDRGDRQPLSMQFQDHHQFSKLDHRRHPLEGAWRMSALARSGGASTRQNGPAAPPTREYSKPIIRENSTPTDSRKHPGPHDVVSANSLAGVHRRYTKIGKN